ncbi:trypsin-like serine protease [Sorangium sp. So ce362]|uniref:trypsin-like serine protease n=1 Tax=Sorangium sp. So ce362 TaxID=3133303 RepID=UPI003F63E19A
MSNLLKPLGFVALLALMGGCAIEGTDSDETGTETETEEVGSSEQEVRNGLWAPLPSADGSVYITAERLANGVLFRKFGTGMLLSPRWILTAGHVVDSSTLSGNPTQITVRWGHATDPSAPTRTYQAVYFHSTHVSGGVTSSTSLTDVDIALVHLTTGFTGAVTRSISTASWSALLALNSTLSCCGYGLTANTGSSTGVLHCGAMPVLTATDKVVVLSPNVLDQLPLYGDSGSSCIDVFGGAGIAGVVSANSFLSPGSPAGGAYVVPADRFRTFVQNTMATVGGL